MNERQEEGQMMDRLRESEAAYRTLAENVPDIVYRVHLNEGRMQFFNDRITDITGFRKDELKKGSVCSMESRIVDEDRQRVIDTVKRAISNRSPFEVEYRFWHKNGTVLTLLERGSVASNDAGAPVHIDGVIRDMTARKRAEEETAERGAMVQQLMDTANVGIALLDGSGRFTRANKRMAALFGRTMEDLIGSAYADHVHPSEREVSSRNLQALLAHELSSVDLDRQYVRKDGTAFWGRLTCKRFYDAKGNDLGLIGTLTDITERKQAEEQLRESEEKFSTIFRRAPLLITLRDLETGRILDVNDKFLETSGFERDELIGRTASEIGWTSEEEQTRILQTMREGGRIVGREHFVRHKDGREVTCLFSGEVISVGGRQRLLSIAQDITERKRTEEALKESQRFLETVIETAPT